MEGKNMMLAIALIILFLVDDKGYQMILTGIYELFGTKITLPTFIVYVLIVAIALDLLRIIFSKAYFDFFLIVVLECIVYLWEFMYNNLVIGISEIFSKNITFSGYIVLCIVIIIIYGIAEILSGIIKNK